MSEESKTNETTDHDEPTATPPQKASPERRTFTIEQIVRRMTGSGEHVIKRLVSKMKPDEKERLKTAYEGWGSSDPDESPRSILQKIRNRIADEERSTKK